MRVRVIKRFKDKYTKVIYKEGAIIELSDSRFEEIQSRGNYLAKKEETPKKGKTKK